MNTLVHNNTITYTVIYTPAITESQQERVSSRESLQGITTPSSKVPASLALEMNSVRIEVNLANTTF